MKIFNMKLLVVFALLYCIVLTACPKDTAVRKAARASYELAGLTHDAIAATERAYNDHILVKEQKDRIAVWLGTIAHGGVKFNQIATQINGVNANVTPTGTLNTLNLILSQEIAGPFLQILAELRALTAGQAVFLQAAIAALRTAILTISAVISQDTYQRLQRSDLSYA
jgi:hypothetical protein